MYYVNGTNPSKANICGLGTGNDVYIYTQFKDGTSGKIYPCPNPDITVAHEMGHLLGLQDVSPSGCSNYIMSAVVVTSGGNYNLRSVQAAECQRAANINDTPAEAPPPPPPSGPEDPTTCHNCGSSGPEPLISTWRATAFC